jgi:hypothetical protein
MSEWTRVKWSEAAQVIELLDWAPPSPAAGRMPPQTYFEDLRRASRLEDAVFFLGLALPRHETVVWAARSVRDISEGRDRSRADADALKAALLWVQDPSEPRRRAAWDAANLAHASCAERLAAMAVFFSGGSLAPDNLPAVPPQNDVAGRVAASAILVAAAKGPDRLAAINRALDEGDAMARWGVNGPPR